MADLISRHAAINTLIRESQADGAYGYLDAKSVNDALERMPSADVVEVVRCKDCKYYYYADNRIPSERGWACANDGCYASQNDYCSWGERKDG